ncbi:hypothetical protein GUITHDRAFT_153594 [Guillardia theta CCMP2712]|uniref:Secreted protein n=1 Tax=Guillardia theta (strain CCMP2712) TaxID=905079 RepID=L1J2K3_GUITC|nr:hypothetical protein GUITHDRAFT_153594 [Guillardia theta CCMP2712]EKX42354.1 hypothetical protein GUITHDRAFT_153594 [Guillardia theta CCMP2712]|eukprot:XP_005829334.1 hypothetical protein GUITHDRAFT_153594 [Guillardia theta CCMP2712]
MSLSRFGVLSLSVSSLTCVSIVSVSQSSLSVRAVDNFELLLVLRRKSTSTDCKSRLSASNK